MSTVSYSTVKDLAYGWEKKAGFATAVLSGIVGDLAHRARGGYHISRDDNPAGNFSIVRPDDRGGPGDAAAAIDMSMAAGDIQVCTARLIRAYSDAGDPRRKYLNAFNGWLGSGDAKRWDIYAQKVATATADHKWHVHLELRRVYVGSATAMTAVLSLLKGDSKESYLSSIGGGSPSGSGVPAYPGRVLARNDRQGAADAAVKVWQQRMVERGWKSLGTADGFFGPKMETVVKAFQTQCGVGADGKIGPKTWPLPWTAKVT